MWRKSLDSVDFHGLPALVARLSGLVYVVRMCVYATPRRLKSKPKCLNNKWGERPTIRPNIGIQDPNFIELSVLLGLNGNAPGMRLE